MKFFNNEWDILLEKEMNKEYFKNLINFIKLEYKNKNIYPEKKYIFRVFKELSYSDIKVVILGQDPYHTEGMANGLSFSVNKDVRIPPSLKNIYIELKNDLNIDNFTHGDLSNWINQGVFLLNSTLTVEESKPNSHSNIGWQIFTNEVISILDKREKPLVFILWGNNAKQKISFINSSTHLILSSSHPSPFSAYKGFFGSKHFSKTNDFLIKNNIKPINWSIK